MAKALPGKFALVSLRMVGRSRGLASVAVCLQTTPTGTARNRHESKTVSFLEHR